MLPAVLLGAVMSALICLPLALPFKATPHDLGLLALLGVVQLAIPCLLSVQVSRVLPAPEVSLISPAGGDLRRHLGLAGCQRGRPPPAP